MNDFRRFINVKTHFGRLFPFPLVKYLDGLLQSLNPLFWVRAAKALPEFYQLMRRQRAEVNTYAKKHGLSAILYFTGDISIYIDQQKMNDLDEILVANFTEDLRKKSHAITRLPTVIITWIGQFLGATLYWNWQSVSDFYNHTINIIKGLV